MSEKDWLFEQKRRLSENFARRSTAKFGNSYITPKTIYNGKYAKLILECSRHGEIFIPAYKHLRSRTGCPLCDIELPAIERQKQFITKAISVHKGKYDYSKVPEAFVNKKVLIGCPEHGFFSQNLRLHANGMKCMGCSRDDDRLSTDDFIKKSSELHGRVYDYSKVVYETVASMVTITCPKHGDWVQRAGSHLQGNGCKECFLERNRGTKEDFIEFATSVHGDTYDYSKVVYKGNKTPVEIICSTHGSFWQKPNAHTSSRYGCRKCYESRGEKAVEVFLKRHNINHTREHVFPCTRFRFDFKLEDVKVLIEFHGHQHYQAVALFGGQTGFEDTKRRDALKVELAKKEGYTLIVINHEDLSSGNLDKVLTRKLRKLFFYWFVFEGKVIVFKKLTQVAEFFQLPSDCLLSEVIEKAEEKYPDLVEIFN